MLVKNDKIKQVKTVVGFDYVGEVFLITNITDKGIITIEFLNRKNGGYVTMSYKEFEEYFEKAQELVWTGWELITIKEKVYQYKTNGKKVILKRCGSFYGNRPITSATSSCSPNDIFDLKKGINLCFARLDVQEAKQHLECLLKEM